MSVKFVVKVIDLCTGCQVQASDPHSVAELEAICHEYKNDYDNCRLVIVPIISEEV